MEIQNENLFKLALQKGINLFLGSGFSIYAKDTNEKNLPLGADLTNELNQLYYGKSTTILSLPQLATNIKAKWKDDFQEFLKYRFTVKSFAPEYLSLRNIKIGNIYTTNIDNLVERIFEGDPERFLNPVFVNGSSDEDPRIDYFQLHGSVARIESAKFDVFDVAASYNTEQGKWASLVHGLTMLPNLFIGYSFSDANTIQAFKLAIQDRRLKSSWILLHKKDEELEEYFHSLGFFIVVGDVKELLNYFAEIVPSNPTRHAVNLEAIAPEYVIPLKSTVVSRSFEDFVLGSDPMWSDIFHPSVTKLHYFDEINNEVASGQNTLILGTPASGKTTLLMQLAANYTLKPKLFVSGISFEKAIHLTDLFLGMQVTIFLDNACLDYRVIDQFCSHKNIQLVACDRELQYEPISDHFKTFRKIFVDDLDDEDIQKIYESIPAHIRTSRTIYHGDRRNVEHASVFEVLQYNINKRSFRDRIRQLVSSVSKDLVNARLLTLIAYLQSNNSILNMDILISIIGGEDGVSYEEIEKRLRALNGMIIELGINHPLVQSNQDHFISRSRLFAEEFIRFIDGKLLRDSILTVIDKITAYVIPNLKMFSRSAFDSEYFLKAFTDTSEGEKYYNYIYSLDSNPYALQQCSLFLSERHQHRKAFEYIERAKNSQKKVNWTIRNTYAILMFNTNITKLETEAAIPEIRKSMEELIECHKNDSRKFYHCRIFVRNVIILIQKNILSELHEDYFSLACDWLREEIRYDPWRVEAKSLLQQLRETKDA